MSGHLSSADMQNLKHPFPILHHHTDPTTMEIMNHFHDLLTPNYPSEIPPPFNFHHSSSSSSSSMGLLFCPDNFLPPELPPNLCPDFPANLARTAPGGNPNVIETATILKAADGTPESCLTNSSPVSAKRTTSSGGRRKRKKNGEEEDEEDRVEEEEVEKKKKPIREVVHVRAKRGQATDSHSLAERIRREKINERLRCLQEIVPGCYKTMGMAVMLDEIINYVQSLQNQVEFLSLKLAAASTYYDFNSDRDNIGTMQRAKTTYEGLKMEKQLKERCQGLSTSNQSFLLDHNFATPYPSLPHNT